MPLLSWMLLSPFGLPRLKWLQKNTAARGTTAAMRHEVAAGLVPWHFHGRNLLWLHDPLVLLSSAWLRWTGRIASPALNHWLFTGIAPLHTSVCPPGCQLPVPVGKNWQERLALSQDAPPPLEQVACRGTGGRVGVALCLLDLPRWDCMSRRRSAELVRVYHFQRAGWCGCPRAALCRRGWACELALRKSNARS